MRDPNEIEAALHRATNREPLTDNELDAIREVLRWFQVWKAWGKLGKIMLWVLVGVGSIAAAVREIRSSPWLGE